MEEIFQTTMIATVNHRLRYVVSAQPALIIVPANTLQLISKLCPIAQGSRLMPGRIDDQGRLLVAEAHTLAKY